MAETADTSALERCTGASDSGPDSTTPAAPGATVQPPTAAPGDAVRAPKTAAVLENKGDAREDEVGVEGGAAGGGGCRGAASDQLEAKPCDQDSAIAKAEEHIAEAKGGVGGGGGSDDGVTNITVTQESAHSGVDMKGSSTLESEDASDDDETTDSEDDDDEDQEDDDKDDDGEEDDDKDDNEPPDTASMLEQVVNKLKVMEVQQELINQREEDIEDAAPVVKRSLDLYQGKASAAAPPDTSAEGTEAEEEGSLKAMDGSSDVENDYGPQSKNKMEESAEESDNQETRDSTSIEKSSFLKDSFESLKKMSQKSIDESGEKKRMQGNVVSWEMTEKGRETDRESSEDAEGVDGTPYLKGDYPFVADPGMEILAKKSQELTADAPEFVPGAGNEVLDLTAEGTVAPFLRLEDSDLDVFQEQVEKQKVEEERPGEIVMEESVLEKLEAPGPEHLVLESSDQVRAFACEVARFLADLAVDIASERAFADSDDVGLMGATDDEEMVTETEDADVAAAAGEKARAGQEEKPDRKEVPSTNTSRASSAPITAPHRVGSSQPHRVKGRAPPPPTTASQVASSAATAGATVSYPPESKSAPSSSGELRQARAVRVSVRAHAQAASAWPHSVPAPAADSVSSCKYTMRDYPAEDADDSKEDGVKASKQLREQVEEGGSECPWRDAVRAAVMGCREDDLPPRSENATGGMQPRHEYFTYVSTLPAVARTSRKEAWGVGFQKGAAEEAGEEGGDEEEDEEGDEESSSADTSTLGAAAAEASALAKASAAASTRGRRRERRDTPRVAETEDEFEYATDELPPVVTRRAITEPEDEEEDDDEDEDEEESVATTRQSGTPQPCMSGVARAGAAAGGLEDETPLSSQPASAEREAGAKAAALAASGPAQRRPPRSRWERWMRRFLGGLGAGLTSQDSTRGATGLSSSTVVDPSAEAVAPAAIVGSPGGGGGARPGVEPGAVSQTGSLPRGATSLGRLAATLRARTLPAAFHATQRNKGKRSKEEKQRAKEEKEREKQRRRAEKDGGASTGATTAGSSTTAGAAASSTSADTQDKAAVEALGALATMKRRSAQLWRRTLGLRRGDSGGVASAAVAPTDEGATAGNRHLQGLTSAEAAMEEVSLGRGVRQMEVVAAPVIVTVQDPDRGGSISASAAPPPGGSGGGKAGSGGGADDGLDATVAAMGQGEDEAMAHAEPGRRRDY